MSKTITAIVATASIAAAALAIPKPAEARCLGCWIGAGIAAGVIGGALASQAYGYGYPAYGYGYGYPAYGMPPTPTRLLTMGTRRRDVTMHAATTATKPSEHDPPVLSAGGITRGLPRQRDALIKLALVDRFMP